MQNLKSLSIQELADLYGQLDSRLALTKGLILLEARERMHDRDFGKWLNDTGIKNESQQSRHRFMMLASYFKDKPMDGISPAAGYVIAEKRNAEIADTLYDECVGKKLSVKAIEQKARELKGLPPPETNVRQKVLNALESLTDAEKRELLLQLANEF